MRQGWLGNVLRPKVAVFFLTFLISASWFCALARD
jgi:threonine/homoserine/homoserine lactone efflux protein